MRLTEEQYRRRAADMDRAARCTGINQEQREGYLVQANRFRSLARRAAELATEPREKDFRELAAEMDRAARRKGLSQEEREDCLVRANHFRLLARRAEERAHDSRAKTRPDLHVVEP